MQCGVVSRQSLRTHNTRSRVLHATCTIPLLNNFVITLRNRQKLANHTFYFFAPGAQTKMLYFRTRSPYQKDLKCEMVLSYKVCPDKINSAQNYDLHKLIIESRLTQAHN